jgi:hypothetical protein
MKILSSALMHSGYTPEILLRIAIGVAVLLLSLLDMDSD